MEPKKADIEAIPNFCSLFGQQEAESRQKSDAGPNPRRDLKHLSAKSALKICAPCASPKSHPERTEKWHLPPKIRPKYWPRCSWSTLSAFSWTNMRRKADSKAIRVQNLPVSFESAIFCRKRCYMFCGFFDPRRLCERPFLTVFAVFSTYPKFSRERQSLEPKKRHKTVPRRKFALHLGKQ